MKEYRLLFLDADDTLFDFKQCEKNALERTFTRFRHSLSPGALDTYREINKQLWGELEKGTVNQDSIKHERFRQLMARLGWDGDYMAVSNTYIREISTESVLVEHAESVCAYLSEKYSLILLTNGISEIQRSRFNRSAIHDHFMKIVISDEACCSKPDPGIFEWAVKGTGSWSREEMMIIGDSLTSDIQGGVNFGIDTCWFNPGGDPAGSMKPDYEIKSLEELFRFL